MGVTIDIRDEVTPLLRTLRGGLQSQRLARFIGVAVQQETRDYLIKIAATRHATALRLGGKFTGHLALAAEKVGAPKSLTAVPGLATLSLEHPGMARAFGDVTITAGTQTPGVEYLTIPIAGESYGNRIYKGGNSRFKGGFFFTSKKGNLLYARREGKGASAKLKLLYLLKKEVKQKQDRTLLPSDQQWSAAAMEGAARYVDLLVKQKGGAPA